MPVTSSIAWKPVRDSHYIVASLQPAGGGLRQLFVRQSVLRDIQALARWDHPVAGLLLGQRLDCALTLTPYMLIESHVELAVSSLDERDMTDAILSLQAHYGRDRSVELLGWYSGRHSADAVVSRTHAAVHRSCFAEPWQTLLTFGEGGTGAFFLRDTSAALWFHAPFHEVVDSPSKARTPQPTCVAWPAYLTTATVVELIETPRVVGTASAGVARAPGKPRRPALAIVKAVGGRAAAASRLAGDRIADIRAKWAASAAQRKAEARAEQEREKERRAREAARRRAEREAAERREAEAAERRAAQAEERRKAAEAEARARREAAEAEARRLAAEAEARRQAEAEAAEARRKAEAEAAEARRKAEAEAAEVRRQAELAEAQRRAAEDAQRRAAEAEAQRIAAEEAQRRAAAEERRRAEQAELRRQGEEAEARRQAIEAEARRVAEEAARRAAAAAAEEARRVAAEAEERRLAEQAALEAQRRAEEAEEDARRRAAEAEEDARRKAREAEEYARRRAADAEALRISVQVAAFRDRLVGAPLEGSRRTQSRSPNGPLADVEDTTASNSPERYLTLAKRDGFEITQKIYRSSTETVWLLVEAESGMRLIVVATDTQVRDASLHYNVRVADSGATSEPGGAAPEHGDAGIRTVYKSETCLEHLRARCRRLRATGTLERDWKALPEVQPVQPASPEVERADALGRDALGRDALGRDALGDGTLGTEAAGR